MTNTFAKLVNAKELFLTYDHIPANIPLKAVLFQLRTKLNFSYYIIKETLNIDINKKEEKSVHVYLRLSTPCNITRANYLDLSFGFGVFNRKWYSGKYTQANTETNVEYLYCMEREEYSKFITNLAFDHYGGELNLDTALLLILEKEGLDKALGYLYANHPELMFEKFSHYKRTLTEIDEMLKNPNSNVKKHLTRPSDFKITTSS